MKSNQKDIFNTIQKKWLTNEYNQGQYDNWTFLGKISSIIGNICSLGGGSKTVSYDTNISGGLSMQLTARLRYGKIHLSAITYYPCAGFILENNANIAVEEYKVEVKSEKGFQAEFKKLARAAKKQARKAIKAYGKDAAVNEKAKSLYLATC